MPLSQDYSDRLYPKLHTIRQHFRTPFHIYDEKGIRDTGAALIQAFAGLDRFREYFAVKALPNPTILRIMHSMGFGFDCSSITELQLARQVGAGPQDILFTSNNTSAEDFTEAALLGGCIMNLDDITLVDKIPSMPELICFRYNPGPRRTGNDIIGNPVEAKYGVSHDQILDAYRSAQAKGAKRFGLHTMLASNELNYSYMVQTASTLLELVKYISQELNITFEFINIGGGLGIPYRPEQTTLDLAALAKEITALFHKFKEKHSYMPALYMESGRFMTGPHGALVVTAINRKNIYRTYIGVDACMSSLMRPGMYGAYHHIDVLDKSTGKDISYPTETVDVVGSLCENNDKFAVQRQLPVVEDGDILIIHDCGAHGHSMGFNYNGKLRPKELLLRVDNRIELIRREEQPADYFATLNFQEDIL